MDPAEHEQQIADLLSDVTLIAAIEQRFDGGDLLRNFCYNGARIVLVEPDLVGDIALQIHRTRQHWLT